MESDLEAPKKRVLVIDDNPVNLKITAHLIRKAGFLADTAETAEAALESLALSRPDLVVTDLQLPGMDGLALTRTIKENPGWRSIPVVLLTAAHSSDEEGNALQAGCECSIAKPVDGEMFPGVIQSFLGSPPPENTRDAELEGLPLEELRKEFLGGAAKECRAFLAQLNPNRMSAPKPDPVSIRKALHRWAGVGGTLGFPAITRRARALEPQVAWSTTDAEELRRGLTQLLHEFTRPAPDSESQPQNLPLAAPGEPTPARPVILVADDDPTMRAVLKLSLEQAGFDCRVADDGVLACAIARKSLPDAIVLDVNMPRLDGFQVLYCLRSMWTTRKIPVLLLTARTDQQGIRRGAELGAEGYMTKPFEVSDLLERVQRLIAEGKGGAARGL